jgi:hypothetical protein
VNFHPASPGSVLAFEAVLAAVVAMIFVGIHVAARRLGRAPGRDLALAASLLLGWLAADALVVRSGLLAMRPMPALPLFLVGNNLVALAFAFSPAGKALARGLPLAALVGFQWFRLPLELILHDWARQGTIPMTMTWTGSNFDVVSGIVALVAVPLAMRWRTAAWIANVVGLLLLMNVARVAVMSSPVPFGWQVQPPLLLAAHLPYAFIVPLAVGAALAGHVVLTRALLAGPGASGGPAR